MIPRFIPDRDHPATRIWYNEHRNHTGAAQLLIAATLALAWFILHQPAVSVNGSTFHPYEPYFWYACLPLTLLLCHYPLCLHFRHPPALICDTNGLSVLAIHRKFQTRRVAEDSTLLYGEATQHSMRLSVDGYTTATVLSAANSIGRKSPPPARCCTALAAAACNLTSPPPAPGRRRAHRLTPARSPPSPLPPRLPAIASAIPSPLPTTTCRASLSKLPTTSNTCRRTL